MPALTLLMAVMASASPVQNGICVGQAWLNVRKGETVERIENVPFEGVVLKTGSDEYNIHAMRPPRDKKDYGVRYLERSAVYVGTPEASYTLMPNRPRPGWARDALARLQTGEAGKAACRRQSRR